MSMIDTSTLPLEVRAKLAELDLELSEGDITQKGYDKKKLRLLEPYGSSMQVQQIATKEVAGPRGSTPPGNAKKKKTANMKKSSKRFYRDDRYRSDIHTEAVQQALVKHGKSRRVPVAPLGLKRSSLVAHNIYASTDESSDEGVLTDASNEASCNTSLQKKIDDSSSDVSSHSFTSSPLLKPKFDPSAVKLKSPKGSKSGLLVGSSISLPPDEEVSSGASKRNTASEARRVTQQIRAWDQRRPIPLSEKIADIMPQILPGNRPSSQRAPPDVTNIFSGNQSSSDATSFLQKGSYASSEYGRHSYTAKTQASAVSSEQTIVTGSQVKDSPAPTKVSAKIQQLLNTLKETEEEQSVEKRSVSNIQSIAMKLQVNHALGMSMMLIILFDGLSRNEIL